MSEKKASVHWEGAGKAGQGQIRTETGALGRCPYGFASRFGEMPAPIATVRDVRFCAPCAPASPGLKTARERGWAK